MLAATANTDVMLDRDTHTIILTRVLAAPCEQVFEAWTRPEHVACWWDPSGEPLAECEIDLRPGGAFRFVNRIPPAPTSSRASIAKSHRRVISSSKQWGRSVASFSTRLAARRF